MEKKPSKAMNRREQRAVLRNQVRVISGNAYDYSRCNAIVMGFPYIVSTEIINEHMFAQVAVTKTFHWSGQGTPKYVQPDTLYFWCRMNSNLTKLFASIREDFVKFILVNSDKGAQFYTALYARDIKPERFKSFSVRS
jgi:hypothetical protein